MTEVRANKSSGLDAGVAAERRSDASMDMGMEMVSVLISIAVESPGEVTPEPMERNRNRKWRKRSGVPVTAWVLRDWKSKRERTAQQQARELGQLH